MSIATAVNTSLQQAAAKKRRSDAQKRQREERRQNKFKALVASRRERILGGALGQNLLFFGTWFQEVMQGIENLQAVMDSKLYKELQTPESFGFAFGENKYSFRTTHCSERNLSVRLSSRIRFWQDQVGDVEVELVPDAGGRYENVPDRGPHRGIRFNRTYPGGPCSWNFSEWCSYRSIWINFSCPEGQIDALAYNEAYEISDRGPNRYLANSPSEEEALTALKSEWETVAGLDLTSPNTGLVFEWDYDGKRATAFLVARLLWECRDPERINSLLRLDKPIPGYSDDEYL